MAAEWLELCKVILQYAIAPMVAIVAYMFKKQQLKIEELERRVGDTEKLTAILNVKMDGMKEDLKDIKRNLSRLVDKT